MSNPIRLKRIYDEAAAEDGQRILVDRIWPRGVSKEKAMLDDWLKDVAPSEGLRKWFGHDPEKFETFAQKYRQELEEDEQRRQKIANLKRLAEEETVTLVYAARDERHNNAVVLKEMIDSMQPL